MQNANRVEPHPMIAPLLDPQERLRAQDQAVDAHVTIIDRRLVVVANERVAIVLTALGKRLSQATGGDGLVRSALGGRS